MEPLTLMSCIVRDYDTIEVQDNFKLYKVTVQYSELKTLNHASHTSFLYPVSKYLLSSWFKGELALGQRTEGWTGLCWWELMGKPQSYKVQVGPFASIVYFWLYGQPRHMSYKPLFGFLSLNTIDIWGLRGFCCGAATSLDSVPTSSTPTVVKNHLQTLPNVTWRGAKLPPVKNHWCML